jgi:hypothetical protein
MLPYSGCMLIRLGSFDFFFYHLRCSTHGSWQHRLLPSLVQVSMELVLLLHGWTEESTLSCRQESGRTLVILFLFCFTAFDTCHCLCQVMILYEAAAGNCHAHHLQHAYFLARWLFFISWHLDLALLGMILFVSIHPKTRITWGVFFLQGAASYTEANSGEDWGIGMNTTSLGWLTELAWMSSRLIQSKIRIISNIIMLHTIFHQASKHTREQQFQNSTVKSSDGKWKASQNRNDCTAIVLTRASSCLPFRLDEIPCQLL